MHSRQVVLRYIHTANWMERVWESLLAHTACTDSRVLDADEWLGIRRTAIDSSSGILSGTLRLCGCCHCTQSRWSQCARRYSIQWFPFADQWQARRMGKRLPGNKVPQSSASLAASRLCDCNFFKFVGFKFLSRVSANKFERSVCRLACWLVPIAGYWRLFGRLSFKADLDTQSGRCAPSCWSISELLPP